MLKLRRLVPEDAENLADGGMDDDSGSLQTGQTVTATSTCASTKI